MTRNRRPHLPGTRLLTIARVLFSEAVVRSLVEPAVADLQHEWRQTAPGGWRRAGSLLRGYASCLWLFVVAPLATPLARDESLDRSPLARVHALHDRALGTGVLMWLLLLAGMWSLIEGFVLLVAVGTLATAAAIHWYNCRHAALNGWRSTPLPGRPEINFAAIPVYGNMAGLLVVVGSLAVIAAGLPVLGLFLLLAALSGAAVAAVLRAWHAAHPASCPNSIMGR